MLVSSLTAWNILILSNGVQSYRLTCPPAHPLASLQIVMQCVYTWSLLFLLKASGLQKLPVRPNLTSSCVRFSDARLVSANLECPSFFAVWTNDQRPPREAWAARPSISWGKAILLKQTKLKRQTDHRTKNTDRKKEQLSVLWVLQKCVQQSVCFA